MLPRLVGFITEALLLPFEADNRQPSGRVGFMKIGRVDVATIVKLEWLGKLNGGAKSN